MHQLKKRFHSWSNLRQAGQVRVSSGSPLASSGESRNVSQGRAEF